MRLVCQCVVVGYDKVVQQLKQLVVQLLASLLLDQPAAVIVDYAA
jgi:hypothetical protein